MDLEERIGFVLIASFLTLSLFSLCKGSYWESPTYKINATISQPISARLSDDLMNGILFTNGSSIGLPQVPIQNMKAKHNATHNYAGEGYNTTYWFTAGEDNTINVSAYMMLCDHLKNSSYNAIINLTYNPIDGGQGMFFGNSTTPSATSPSLSPTEEWGFPQPDKFKLIANNTAPGQSVFFRFWLDPYPDNVPSGIYTTTFKIRVIDYTIDPGDSSC